MPAEEEYVAHPRLYGAPAYARPPLQIAPKPLPVDPDDLPLAALQTTQERAIAERLLTTPQGVALPPSDARSVIQPRGRPLLLGVIADKILRRAS